MKEQIENAYKNLEDATKLAFDYGEESISAKSTLDIAIANAYADGIVEGKNQNERDGWIAKNFWELQHLVTDAQHRDRVARHELELARIEVEKTRALLRLMEITQS